MLGTDKKLKSKEIHEVATRKYVFLFPLEMKQYCMKYLKFFMCNKIVFYFILTIEFHMILLVLNFKKLLKLYLPIIIFEVICVHNDLRAEFKR